MKRVHYIDNYLLNPQHPVTVNLIGAGGTGSQVLTCLARLDVTLRALGHPGLFVTLYDPDIVTDANIGRQLFGVNPTTGAVQIKALFPNPDRELLSGTVGNVILQGLNTDAITVPITATVEMQDKIIAYRLKSRKAEAAYLTVDRLNDGNRFVVKQGLSVGDTIVVEGVGQVKEGMIVTPKTVAP